MLAIVAWVRVHVGGGYRCTSELPASNASLGQGRVLETVGILFREYCLGEENSLSLTEFRGKLGEFRGKLGEFWEKLGEFAFSHR